MAEGLEVEAVVVFKGLLGDMLAQSGTTKRTDTIEPPVSKADIAPVLRRFQQVNSSKTRDEKKATQYAVIETAVRDAFVDLLATYSIDQPEFVQIWNLLDIVNILADDGECDPALLFWLVEELMDAQTIAGCRKIFDYLESRRERMIAKDFGAKKLVILRTCNELLRRLSRAEDTAFCGRVFIFMFQSFPLGDKSSVNLRGEFHVENVTAFDEVPPKQEGAADQMEIDTEGKAVPAGPSADSKDSGATAADDARTGAKSVSFNAKDTMAEKGLGPDDLYPIFWSLQQSFSQPKKLFDHEHFNNFKDGFSATMAMFRSVQNESSARASSKNGNGEGESRGAKRKHGQDEDGLAHAFNPKYLTSRDLFELEIRDLSFRRNILVQALIIMDFLISLGGKAKEKLATIPKQNASVTYQDQTLSEEDVKWAMDTKKSIAEYLKQGYDGAFFYRMVDSVLSRDKHWVRWKLEGCPSIELPSIPADAHLAAKATAKKVTANKRLRPKPMGSLDLAFLGEADGTAGMERLKKAERYAQPSLASFRQRIAEDELEIDMPTSAESKEAAQNGKASKSWRALRIASKTRLARFDKIDDAEKIEAIFEEPEAPRAAGETED